MNRFTTSVRNFCEDEAGQGITEYGAIIAFVAILVAITFGITSGTLAQSISAAFSVVVSQMNALCNDAASASS